MAKARRESEFEKAVVALTKKLHIHCRKCTGQSGTPDREFLAHGVWLKIELKRKGERPKAHQIEEIDEITKHGGFATWADNIEIVERFLRHLRHGELFHLQALVRRNNYWTK